jgi:hypothetical protein
MIDGPRLQGDDGGAMMEYVGNNWMFEMLLIKAIRWFLSSAIW